MLKENQLLYSILSNYYLRTPLLPLNYIDEFLKGLSFSKLFENRLFIEALYLASPSLYLQVKNWQEGKLKDSKKVKRLKFALLKYVTRMSTRCTPFGLFAGCNLGEFGKESIVQLDNISKYKRFTKLDMSILDLLKTDILKHDILKKQLLFFPNNSIYKVANNYRYVEYELEKGKRTYFLQEVEASQYLNKILTCSIDGKTIEDIANSIVDREISIENAIEFVSELIQNQLLVSEIELNVTGDNYFRNLIRYIEKLDNSSNYTKLLNQISDSMSEIDKYFGNSIKKYENIQKIIHQTDISVETKNLFQTDSYTSTTTNVLNNRIKKDIYKALTFFNRITINDENSYLKTFKTAFVVRYENEEIPLNVALDTEIGIGYGYKKGTSSSFLNDLILFGSKKQNRNIIWKDIDDILLEKLIEASKKNQKVIKIKSKDFKNNLLNWDDLPDTFSALIEVYKENNSEKIFINSIGGSSASNLLGRFSNNDRDLLKHLKNITIVEEQLNQGSIIAEIVHLPQSRTGNILHRANIRNYEIPYLGKSSVNEEYQIPVEDIMVSVRNNQIVLRSIRLNKMIIPKLSNAHNYSLDSLPIYEFLCDLQYQDLRISLGFVWNSALLKQQFLPRIEFEGIILSKARWKLKTKDFIANSQFNIEQWKKKLQLPDIVELVEGDNRLFIDLNNEFSIEMLADTVKNNKNFIFEEFLFTSENSIVKNQSNSFCNQFTISFVKEKIENQ